MLAVTMPQGGLVWPFQWSSLMTNKTSPVAMDLTSGSSVDNNENATLSQLLEAAFPEDESTTMAPLSGISNTDTFISPPILNMEMNNDLLDLTKPLECLQHGISSMSLDSLNNEHFVDAVEVVQTEPDDSPISRLSGLNSCPDTDVESVEESKKEISKNEDVFDRNSEEKRQLMSDGSNSMQETTESDSVKVSAVSQSPESYSTLYKAFEIAQEEPIDTDTCNKPRESTLDMLNRTSPKLQRVALRKANISPDKHPTNATSEKTILTTLSKQSPLTNSSIKLTWKKFGTENYESVTTFADILQKKATPSPKNENFLNIQETNDIIGTHWTELMQKKSDFEMENGIVQRRVRRTNNISRPKSLPIQLRHIRRPASRPLKTPEDKKSKTFEDFQFQNNLNTLEEGHSIQRDLHKKKSRGYYEPTYMSHGYHTLPAVLNWYKNRQDIYTNQSQTNVKKRSPIVNRMADWKSPKGKEKIKNIIERDVGKVGTRDKRNIGRSVVDDKRDITRGGSTKKRDDSTTMKGVARSLPLGDARNDDGFDDWQNLQPQELPPQDITVSPRPRKQPMNVDMVVMKGLVAAVSSAVDLILNHFSRTSEMGPQDKSILGDTLRTPVIGLLVLDHLCPAIANILKDGMKPYIRNYIIGRAKNSIWQVVEATTELGPGTRSLYELVCLIQEQKSLSTDMLKFNAFIFGLLSTKCLEVWLNHIRRHPDIVRTYYEKNAFLSQSSTSTNQFFNDLMVAVQPLSLLPFKLALDFELKYTQRQSYRTRQESFTSADSQAFMSLPWLGRRNSQTSQEPPASWQSWVKPSSILGSLRVPKEQSGKTAADSMEVKSELQKPDASWRRSKALLKTAIVGRDKASFKKRSDHISQSLTHASRKTETEGVAAKDKTFQTQVNTVKHDSIPKTERNQIQEGVSTQTGSNRGWSIGWMTGAVSKKLYGEDMPKQDVRYPVIGADTDNLEGLQRTSQSEYSAEEAYASTSMMNSIGTNVIKAFDYMLLPKQTPKEFQMVDMRNTRPQKESRLDEARQESLLPFEQTMSLSTEPERQRTPQSDSKQTLVKTRCHNVSMQQGFLSFSKGEVLQLKETIDSELLLCGRGQETGLVYRSHVEETKPIL